MTPVFDLAILDTGVSGTVVVHARYGDDSAITRLTCASKLKNLLRYRDLLEKAVSGNELESLRKSDLTQFQRDLFDLVVADSVLSLYGSLPSSTACRIHILSDQPEIQSLPWELMAAAGDSGAPRLDRPIVRIVPTVGTKLPGAIDLSRQKLRILFASADPTDQLSTNWVELENSIRNTFESELPDNCTFTPESSTSVDSLRTAVTGGDYDIFHFHGHGEVQAGIGQLVLVNKDHTSARLSAQRLCTMLQGRGIRLVILSACSTAAGNFAENFAVTAAALIRAGIPAVVANQMVIQDETVAPFVTSMYASLLRTGDIDTAVMEGRIRLFTDITEMDRVPVEWAIPTLYRHAGGAKVINV
jgi:hypothetical protein